MGQNAGIGLWTSQNISCGNAGRTKVNVSAVFSPILRLVYLVKSICASLGHQNILSLLSCNITATSPSSIQQISVLLYRFQSKYWFKKLAIDGLLLDDDVACKRILVGGVIRVKNCNKKVIIAACIIFSIIAGSLLWGDNIECGISLAWINCIFISLLTLVFSIRKKRKKGSLIYIIR